MTGGARKRSRVAYIDSALGTDLTRMYPDGSSTLTLKQRLTALTQPPSSSSPRSSPIRRKFSAPWVKRTVPPCGHQNEDSLQSIIGKMIYQAGVDYEYAYPHVMISTIVENFMTGPARCNTISRKLQCPNSIVVFPSCRVVLNASALPDPREVDYDVLLSCVLSP